MIGFIFRRFLQAIVVVLGVMLIVFLLAHIIPGGAARAALGPRATTAPDQPVQPPEPLRPAPAETSSGSTSTVWSPAQPRVLVPLEPGGHPGHPATAPQDPRARGHRRRWWPLVIAVPLGILQVVRRNKPIDYVLTSLSFVFYAMPVFLLGALLILYFSFDLHWFSVRGPPGDRRWAPSCPSPGRSSCPCSRSPRSPIASFSRYMRSSMMETLTEDYVRTARAKGAGPRRVLYVHALRNAVIPIITLLGLSIPAIVGGAIITESRVQLPGHGPARLPGHHQHRHPPAPRHHVLGHAGHRSPARSSPTSSTPSVDPRIRYAN